MKRNEIERTVSIPLGIRLSRAITVAPCMVKIYPFGGPTGVIFPGRRPWRCYMLGRALARLYGSPQVITFGSGFTAGITAKFSVLAQAPCGSNFANFIYLHSLFCVLKRRVENKGIHSAR